MDVKTITAPTGRVLAREADGPLYTGELKRYTAFVDWPHARGDFEEIDVDAVSEGYARQLVEQLLKRDYDPDGTIVRLEQRFGLYL